MSVTVIVGPGWGTVTVGPGRSTVTVTVGRGSGALIVPVGVGFPPCGELTAPMTAGTVIVTITASPIAAPIANMAPDRSHFRGFSCRL